MGGEGKGRGLSLPKVNFLVTSLPLIAHHFRCFHIIFTVNKYIMMMILDADETNRVSTSLKSTDTNV